jgi:hypothetical protein
MNPFAVQVLKALFLVKYVDEFKPTARNVGILMRDRFDLDPTRHRAGHRQALALLEQNSPTSSATGTSTSSSPTRRRTSSRRSRRSGSTRRT